MKRLDRVLTMAAVVLLVAAVASFALARDGSNTLRAVASTERPAGDRASQERDGDGRGTRARTAPLVGDVQGPCDEPEHFGDPECTGAALDDDRRHGDGGDNSGPGGGDGADDNSGLGGGDDADDNSGPGRGDHTDDNSGPGGGDDDHGRHGHDDDHDDDDDDNSGPGSGDDDDDGQGGSGRG